MAQFRRLLVGALKKFKDGAPALGAAEKIVYARLASFEGVVPKETDWRTLGGRSSPPTPERTAGALAQS